MRIWWGANRNSSCTGSFVFTLQRDQDWHQDLVLVAARRGLDADQGIEVDDSDAQRAIFHEHTRADQLVVAPAIVQRTQGIEWPEVRREVVLPGARKYGRRHAQATITRLSHEGAEPIQQSHESINIVGRAPMHDVEILRGGGRAVQHGGGSSHDDELDAGINERLQERFEISLFRMRHGTQPRRDVRGLPRAGAHVHRANATIAAATCLLPPQRQATRPALLRSPCRVVSGLVA
jgi:hypothetical protein